MVLFTQWVVGWTKSSTIVSSVEQGVISDMARNRDGCETSALRLKAAGVGAAAQHNQTRLGPQVTHAGGVIHNVGIQSFIRTS